MGLRWADTRVCPYSYLSETTRTYQLTATKVGDGTERRAYQNSMKSLGRGLGEPFLSRAGHGISPESASLTRVRARNLSPPPHLYRNV
jgi:hypothetical protein